MIFLLFLVGLGTKPADIFRVGWRALLVAILGVIVPFIPGYLDLRLGADADRGGLRRRGDGRDFRGHYPRACWGQIGLLNLEVSRIILGAAVIDDILGL